MGNINSCWAEPAETSSTCVTKTATAAHNFIVPNYSLLRAMGAGEFVSSKSFMAGGHRWKIRFYPNGHLSAGHAAAFLCLLGRASSNKGVHTKFTLSLLLENGKVHQDSKRSGECVARTFGDASSTSGFDDFIHKSKLPQDCFNIRCDLTVIKKPSIVRTSSTTQDAAMAEGIHVP